MWISIRNKYSHGSLRKRKKFSVKVWDVNYIGNHLQYILKLFYWSFQWSLTKENRIFIRVEFTRKKCKTAICFHTEGVLHIFMLYNLLGPGASFYRKSKINIKRKSSYEIGWFHNWPMIISHRLYAFHFTNDDFPL